MQAQLSELQKMFCKLVNVNKSRVEPKQRFSKDLAFHLLEFLIQKPTLSLLKPFNMHTSHPATPFNTKEGFIKGEVLHLLRTNSVKDNFYKHKGDFEQKLCNRGYPTMLICKILTEVQFSDRTKALCNKAKKILPFVTTYTPATPNLTKILMKHWHIIQQQPKLAHIFKQQPIVSYRKEKSLKDILVPTKLPLITPQS